MEYSFHFYNERATDGVTMALDKLLKDDVSIKLSTRKPTAFKKQFDGNLHPTPVVVCVGSDLAVGDSLGPLVGSLLKHKTQGLGVFIYGTLTSPITAKEIKYLRPFLKETHPTSPCIAVDAAVGESGDVGLIKVLHKGIEILE